MTPEDLPVEEYEAQLAAKIGRLRALMEPFAAPAIEVFRSPPAHYRMRAEFRVWHDGDDLYHIIFDQETRERIRVDRFPAASELIGELMPRLIDALRGAPVLRRKLFQIDYLSTTSGQVIVSLLYHRPLGDDWIAAARALRERLRVESSAAAIELIGRATKTKICLDHDHVDERLTVGGRELVYRQVENSFTQPNAAVSVKMLEWARAVTAGSEGDLLELYCGNGNFSIALADNFRRVLATEVAKPSVAAAQFNIAANGADNVQIVRMSAEDFTQALRGVREFRRLRGIDLASYRCDTVLVDPPRSGLDDETVALVQGYPRIVYISCNPATLRANLEVLAKTHAIDRLALFDQFPYTHHMECGVALTRRG